MKTQVEHCRKPCLPNELSNQCVFAIVLQLSCVNSAPSSGKILVAAIDGAIHSMFQRK